VEVITTVLIALLLVVFVMLALDMAVPASANPYGLGAEYAPYEETYTAQDAEVSAKEAEIEARLARGAITEAQAEEEWIALYNSPEYAVEESFDEDEDDSATDASFLQADNAYTRSMTGRFLTLSLVSMTLMALLLWAGVVLWTRGVPLGAAPLLAGAALGSYAVGVGGASNTGLGRLLIAGVVVAAVIVAGRAAFKEQNAC
jgi:hypothetical protein